MNEAITLTSHSFGRLLNAALKPHPDDPGHGGPWGPYGPIGPVAAGLGHEFDHVQLNPQPLPPRVARAIRCRPCTPHA
jgi:hypothetical protein